MGDIFIHPSPRDIAVTEKANSGAVLSPEEARDFTHASFVAAMNAMLGPKPDRQISRDGYGREDWNKL